MRDWADVYVPPLDDRLALQSKALFFVPTALEWCSSRDLTVARLSAISSAASFPAARAGRNVIGKVLRFQPVAYDSALGFVNVLNRALGETQFSTKDIVACVFRLRDIAEVLSALNKKAEDLAAGSGVSLEIAQAAIQRYRLQLYDALSIWQFLRDCAARGNFRDSAIEQVLTDKPQDFIKTDVRSDLPMAVKLLDDRDFVYGWENLRAAPSSGHYWALQEGTPDAFERN